MNTPENTSHAGGLLVLATLAYIVSGLWLFAAFDRFSPALKVTYWWFFPIHAAVLSWFSAIAQSPERFLDNSALWYGIVVFFAFVMLAMGGC